MATPVRSGAVLSATLLALLPLFGTPAHAVERQAKDIVTGVCSTCHAAGKENAPRIGDRAAWIPRMSNGLDALVASAIRGHGAMPSRGGMADLRDSEIRAAVVYMFNGGEPPAAAPVVASPADPHHQVIDGTDIYLGLMRADAVRAAHGKVPAGRDYYHVNISLADHGSSRPVTDAEVKVQVSDGMSSQAHPLGLVAANNAVSYGGYFRFEAGSAYRITAEIKRPGVPRVIEAKFDFKAP